MNAVFSATKTSLVNAWLQAGCEQLQALFSEREELLDVVLSIEDAQPGDIASLMMRECEARTMKAAQDVLNAPVHGPGDLYAKYSTILLYEEFYLERAALLRPLLQHVCDDARSVLGNPVQDEASQAGGEGPRDIEGASPATATDPSQVSN